MVVWYRVYYGAPFKVFSRVTHGYLLSPNICNMVVDVVLRHWVTFVASTEDLVDPGVAGMEGFGRDVQKLSAPCHALGGDYADSYRLRMKGGGGGEPTGNGTA